MKAKSVFTKFMVGKVDLLVYLVILLSLLGWRSYQWWQQIGKSRVIGGDLVAESVIFESPSRYQTYLSLPFQAWTARVNPKIAQSQRVAQLAAGDRWRFKAVWRQGETGRFYLQVVEVLAVTQLTEPGNWWGLIRWLEDIRNQLIEAYQAYLAEPYNSLLSGIVLGKQSQFPPDWYAALITTGTVHIVAASGYNISVVAGALVAGLVLVVKRRQALWLALLGIVIYVVLAGATPPVIRAGIMGAMLIWSQQLGRLYLPGYSLALTGLLMLIIWPWLVFSIAFWLSLAATAGIMGGGPSLARVIERWSGKLIPPWWRVIQKDMVTTGAATLATLPLIGLFFQRLSLVAPLTNLLVLWTVPPLMMLGGGVGLLSFIWPAAAQALAYLSYPLLWWFVTAVETTAAWPLASVTLPNLNWYWVSGYWLLLFGWWWKGSARTKD
ncbi:hypothetical protein A2W24_02470 [Microgenomates group bacterium RBG_16_45_19]|nr:MAG: hypothetical protein A2W24_02470 [Microgenomates group bacterium RBG_16_45_19]